MRFNGSRTLHLYLIIRKKDGEPIDKDLWGELEPEEGSFSSHFLRVCRTDIHHRQRRKRKKSRKKNQRKRKQRPLRQMVCRRHRAWKHRLA